MKWRSPARRATALVTACVVASLSTSMLQAPRASAASPAITASLQAPATVLAGKPVSFTLTAANPSAAGAQPEYNTSFRDLLPPGLTYQPGSTTPADLGEPTVLTDPGNGRQTLIWSDVFDLAIGSSASLSFSATASLPVGSTANNVITAYASTEPRYVAHFTAAGLPIADSRIQPAASNQGSTVITALQLSKTESSPAAKLLRGAHQHSTVYTLRLGNSSQAATTGVTVLDYLPAAQEFLGCGQLDNTAGATVEYPGAARLSTTPAVGTDCLAPTSVDTVLNPPANGTVSYPPGVYTKLTWTLGTLAAGQVSTIRYAAAVALRQNALFASGPSPASLGQAANLDNNTGASTRQLNDAAPLVNYAHAEGSYTGAAIGGAASVSDTSHQVSVHDLRIQKSVTPSEFVAGGLAGYTLRLDSGEYTDASAIVITDVLPNGTCPLDENGNHAAGAPADCAPGAGFAPSLPYQSVSQNPDGSFTVVFQPVAVPRNGSLSITYAARNRASYTGGPLAGLPPAAGDSFTNTATGQGTSTPAPGTGVTADQPVRDASSATQTSSTSTLSASVAARTTPMDCSAPGLSYGAGNPVFAKGDRICFQLRVGLSAVNQTRNAVLTDFLPVDTAYEDGSVSYPAANTVDPAQISFDAAAAASGALSWRLGTTQADGSTTVAAGKVFVVRFSVLVTAPAPGPAPDKLGNIAKLRSTDSAGKASSLRAGADFQIAAAPPVAIAKGVASLNGAVPAPGPNADHVLVRQGDSVVFEIEVDNTGSAATSNAVAVDDLRLWDVLPAGLRCAQLSAVSDAGVCTDPAAPGHPAFTGDSSLSALVWSGAALPAGARKSYRYTVTIPAGVSVSTVFDNTAAVRSYSAGTDLPGAGTGSATFYPSANIESTVLPGQYDAPAARDTSDVYLRNVTVSSGVSSAVAETGNIGAEPSPAGSTQATIGEQLSWTVTARVPAGSSVYNAFLSSPLPAGLSLVSAVATYTADAGSPADQPLPAGFTFDPAAPSIRWPASYDNSTGADHLFALTITARLASVAANQHGVSRTSTAAFSSATAVTGGALLPARTAASSVTDVEPLPSLTKTNDAGAGVAGGQSVSYLVKAANAAGRPALHDSWVADCLPPGLTFTGYATPPAGVSAAAATAGDGSNGCPPGTTLLSWNVGDLAGGSSRSLAYNVTVDPSASGKASYPNLAALTGNSLTGVRTSPAQQGNPAGRQYSAGATSTVLVVGATALTSVAPASATVGGVVNYTTSAVLPAGVNFYNLSLIDQLPAGIDPSSVTQAAISCAYADSSPCTPDTAVRLSSAAGAGAATLIGWLLGDVPTASQTRTVSVQYSARVADIAGVSAGSVLPNSARVGWDNAARTPPAGAGAAYEQSSPSAAAAVTVLEPGLSVAKAVSRLHPEPGQSFGYTVTVSNRNTAATSAAHNITVTDTVPAGVVVDPASVSGGGSVSGAHPTTGGGVLSWTLPGPLAKGASLPGLSYTATLAPSGSVTAAALVNTARITGYDSLPVGGRHYTGPSATATITAYFPRVTTTKSTPATSTAYIGESFSWLVTVRNTGSGVAYQVASTDTLPPNWSYDAGSARVSVAGGPATAVEPAVVSAGAVQTLSWTGLGALNPTAALTIAFTATPQPGVSGSPGVGLTVNHTNSASSSAQDATGASANGAGGYTAGPGSAAARIASADLSLTKAVGAAPVAGGSGSWVLTVRNNGPNPATGPFTVVDQFSNPSPSAVSSISASGAGWSCSTASPISCQRTAAGDTLASGASFPAITIGYSVDPSAPEGSTLSSVATVSARTQDPATANNSANAVATVRARADLAVTVGLASPQLIAGAPASYQVAVTNSGPSNAVGPISVDASLPAGSSFVSASGAGWSCDPIAAGTTGAVLHCTMPGPLSVGAAPAAVSVTVAIASSQTGPVTATASVAAPTADPTPANNFDVQTDTPSLRADLVIQKLHLTDPFVAGGRADYQIQVRNAGESDASGVAVSDTLPAGLSYHSFDSTDPNWTCSAAGQQVSCGYSASLVAGAGSSFTLSVNLAAGFVGPASNTATVSASTPDPVPANNSDVDDSSVSQVADLSIAASHTGSAIAGNLLTFELAVHNAGPSDITGPVTVLDSLPAGMSFDSATGAGWSCDYASGARVLSCVLAAGLAAGAGAGRLDVVVRLSPDTGPATIANTATVSSGAADSDLADNADTDQVGVLTSAALSLTKTLSTPTPVLAGATASFVLSASNAGPSDAVTVTVTDTLPAQLSFRSYTGSGWACSVAGQSVVCARDRLAAGATAPDLVLNTQVSASTPVTLPAGAATLVNNAGIESSTAGSRTNPSPVPVAVRAQAELALVVAPTRPQADAGESLGWQLTVSNTGPSDAAGPITVTDTLPSYQSYLSASGGWDCSADAAPAPPSATARQTVTCALDQSLAVGETAPVLQLQVQLDPLSPAGAETNQALASSPTPGTPASGSATVVVGKLADLSLAMLHTGNGRVGEPMDFTLRVRNAGPSTAGQLTISNPLPAGLSFVSGAGSGWTCAADADQLVSCALSDPVAAGADSAALTLRVLVGAAAYPSVANPATVSSGDPALTGSADATDQLAVDPAAQLGITLKHQGDLAVGRSASYLITVTNSGPTASPGPIRVSDTLPDGLSYRSAAGAGWSCVVSGQQLTCDHDGALPVAGTTSITVTVAVTARAYPEVTSAATVTGPGSSPATGSDTAPVQPSVALRLGKSLISYVNGVASYRLTVTNQGQNATVAPVIVTDPLPTGLSYASATGDGWLCTRAGTVLRCAHQASLPIGPASPITLVTLVSAAPATVIRNVATVTGGGGQSSSTVVASDAAILTVSLSGSGSSGSGSAGSGPSGSGPSGSGPSGSGPSGAGPSGSGAGSLPRTGRELGQPVALALLLLLAGLGLRLSGRRRTG
ncbi:hypothetical protein [Jatrophihabitans sp.]|uniref:hypothetical protein n=1 Tax=Jatrophihabitans sp. TaxID=1932789 RepID=UPI0038CDB98B